MNNNYVYIICGCYVSMLCALPATDGISDQKCNVKSLTALSFKVIMDTIEKSHDQASSLFRVMNKQVIEDIVLGQRVLENKFLDCDSLNKLYQTYRRVMFSNDIRQAIFKCLKQQAQNSISVEIKGPHVLMPRICYFESLCHRSVIIRENNSYIQS